MLSELSNFYKGKKVFVTGHTGFKGSWLVYWLYSMGAIVKGYALPPQHENALFHQMKGTDLCESVIGDIRDAQKLENELLSFQPDLVFHLAAQPLVLLSYEQPELTYETNVIGTGYLLKALRSLPKQCAAVLITTDKVYENKEWVFPYRETDPLGGYDPYSSSKAACEILIASYRQSFFHPKNYKDHLKGIAVARAGNVIGGGDWSDNRIIPDIVKALSIGEQILVRNPHAVRPWQHVLEPLSGYLLLGMKVYENPAKYSEAWNFGPWLADTFPVLSLVEKSIEVWGSGTYTIQQASQAFHEAGLLKLDISKAHSLLNWKPIWSCDIAIERTINWYKNAFNTDVKQLMFEDIQHYLSQVFEHGS